MLPVVMRSAPLHLLREFLGLVNLLMSVCIDGHYVPIFELAHAVLYLCHKVFGPRRLGSYTKS
uniref:hypothetical protein n=1 Tax=Polynucleobacter sp. TaxID=2029855 RepID=UPI0040487BAA